MYKKMFLTGVLLTALGMQASIASARPAPTPVCIQILYKEAGGLGATYVKDHLDCMFVLVGNNLLVNTHSTKPGEPGYVKNANSFLNFTPTNIRKLGYPLYKIQQTGSYFYFTTPVLIF